MARSYYCNHCGRKVSSKAVKCPGCGRYFGAVLCPRCGFSGDESLFSEGCPSCGYLGEKGEEKGNTASFTRERITKRERRALLNLPPLFFFVGIGLLAALLWFLISLY